MGSFFRLSGLALQIFSIAMIRSEPVQRLKLVQGLPNVEEFYLRARKRDQETSVTRPLEKDLDQKVKSRIYYHIFRSVVCYNKGMATLQSNPFLKIALRDSLTRYPHTSLTVRTSSKPELTEYVFPVYVRDVTNNDDLKQLFVSEEYDVNLDHAPYSAGRFLFRKNEGLGSLTVVELVEEAARVVEDSKMKVEQLYIESRNEAQPTGKKSSVKSHYRGHKISIWLNLIPQLHQPGLGLFNMQHHHFQEESLKYYDGSLRPQSQRPSLPDATSLTTTTSTSTTTTFAPTTVKRVKGANRGGLSSQPTLTTECSNVSVNAAADTVRTQTDTKAKNQSGTANGTLWHIMSSQQYDSITTVLTITLGVGCFLLLLNFLIFAGIYRQRGKNTRVRSRRKKKPELDSPAEHHLIQGKFLDPMPIRYSTEPSTSYATDCNISLKQFEAGVMNARMTPTKTTIVSAECSSTYVPEHFENESDLTDDSPSIKVSPSIPEPPPPPRTLPPTCYQNVMKASTAQQTLPSAKKRVQIQEISV